MGGSSAKVVSLLATHGEGEPTDNSQAFYEWMKEADDGTLSSVKYTVFGLGNKQYEHYNSMGKWCDRRMKELGAERFFKLGLGDDDDNLEGDFEEWKEALWKQLCPEDSVSRAAPAPNYVAEMLPSKSQKLKSVESAGALPFR